MAPAATVHPRPRSTFTDEQGDPSATATRRSRPTRLVCAIEDDWDAVGMRASGSHSITFAASSCPAAALRGGFQVGDTAALP